MRLPYSVRLLASGDALRKPALTWAAHSVRGVREENQDAVVMTSPDQTGLASKRGVLAVVCDGIGGEDGGAIASEVAASTAMRVFYASDAADEATAVQEAVAAANAAVCEAATGHGLVRMGTTIVMAAVTSTQVTIGHVGDSRAYLLCRGQSLRQLTKDHVDAHQSGLQRSLGAIGCSDGDVVCETFGPGARLLLCTDGLYRALPEYMIEARLSQHGSVETIARELVAAAFINSSRDNITAAVILCDDAATRMRGAWQAVQTLVTKKRGRRGYD